MRPRLFRPALVLTSLAGLLGTVPPARADIIKTVTFVWEVHFSGGSSYACTSSGPTIDVGKCPTGVRTGVSPLPQTGLPTDVVPNNEVSVTGGNTRGYVLGTVAGLCAATGASFLKPGKPPAHETVGCSMAGGGSATGSCGLGSSRGIVDVVVLGQLYTISYGWRDLGFATITGHVFKPSSGQWGKFYGAAVAVPVPATTGGPTPGNSCANKTADTFTVPGEGTIVMFTHDV